VAVESVQSLVITNASKSWAVFKARTTNPKRYLAKPSQGILAPQQAIDMKIHLVGSEAPRNEEEALLSRDKFQLLNVSVDKELTSEEVSQLWSDLSKQHNPKAKKYAYNELIFTCLVSFVEHRFKTVDALPESPLDVSFDASVSGLSKAASPDLKVKKLTPVPSAASLDLQEIKEVPRLSASASSLAPPAPLRYSKHSSISIEKREKPKESNASTSAFDARDEPDFIKISKSTYNLMTSQIKEYEEAIKFTADAVAAKNQAEERIALLLKESTTLRIRIQNLDERLLEMNKFQDADYIEKIRQSLGEIVIFWC
jgi:hypothetical protein